MEQSGQDWLHYGDMWPQLCPGLYIMDGHVGQHKREGPWESVGTQLTAGQERRKKCCINQAAYMI